MLISTREMFMHNKKYEISCDRYILIDEDLGIHLEDEHVCKKIPLDLTHYAQNDPCYETKVDLSGRVERSTP
jgi:hypothetical protein